MPFKSGFVTIIGRPNVGKSTLMNALIGQKVAIVSDRPQTTRNKITGILSLPDAQIVFLDTPGIHAHKGRLNELMVKAAKEACDGVDIVIFMVAADDRPGQDEQEIMAFIAKLNAPVFLAINKIDLVNKESLLPLIKEYSGAHDFKEIIPVSSLKKQNIDDLKDTIIRSLPEGPKYFPDDQLSEEPERFIAAEIIREKIFRMTKDEVPYSTAVLVEEMKDKGDIVFVRADIYVEKDSHKGIIIGAKGRMLKEIGQAARKDIERLIGVKVYLELWVKVKKDWRERPSDLRELGYK